MYKNWCHNILDDIYVISDVHKGNNSRPWHLFPYLRIAKKFLGMGFHPVEIPKNRQRIAFYQQIDKELRFI